MSQPDPPNRLVSVTKSINVGGNTCANCGAELVGSYCHECSQAATSPIVPMRQFVREAIGEVIEIDRRLWRALRVLLFRPGQLTTEYLTGRRQRYLSPIKLYIVTSFIYFLLTTIFHDVPTQALFANNAAHGAALRVALVISVPIFAATVHVLHARYRRLFLEHVIFSMHFYAFYFTVTIVGILLYLAIESLFPSTWSGAAVRLVDFSTRFVPPMYLAVALTDYYRQHVVLGILKGAILFGFLYVITQILETLLLRSPWS